MTYKRFIIAICLLAASGVMAGCSKQKPPVTNVPAIVTGGGDTTTYGPYEVEVSDDSYFTPEKECRPGYEKTAWHDSGYPYYIQCSLVPNTVKK